MGQHEFITELDKVTGEFLNDGVRSHLGASQIGERCARKVWLDFKWAGEEKVGGRMRRLWDRGHQEEHRVVKWLRLMGVEVRDYAQRLMYHDGSDSYVCMDWDAAPSYYGTEADDQIWKECDDVSDDPVHIRRATDRGQGPSQWGFAADFGVDVPGEDPRTGEPFLGKGHFAGSGDGKVSEAVAKWFPEVAGKGWGLFECKTHKDSSFKDLVRKGVQSSKPVHYIQMQIYMHNLGLKWALYIAVNKDTDEIHPEIVIYRGEVAGAFMDRAKSIIEMGTAPAKLTEDPSWFECRYCTYKDQCHYDAGIEKTNCRSCAYSVAVSGGQWYCGYYSRVLPEEFIKRGCGIWVPCI